MTIALFLFGCGLVGCGFLGGILTGYLKGVKETERRWSEAVERAEFYIKKRT